MASGCRDCGACTRSLAWRTMVLILWRTWGWMFTMWMRRCPQCHHALGRHARRRDGSFMD
ncbi:hypothetical protein CFP66_23795 [Pseudonocardia sp. MH-G8]|nr:hypothetical protein CFP66_23795 [Pseudonocardia sp. MH-G8]